ncbi:MAG TPA: hypothetical protein VHC49_25785 [Mycobacteriales bacterium]|nr:hypothetical protein [Mycobacteriales bacterium]
MKSWWSLRALRHMVLGALPVVIVSLGLLIGLIAYERSSTAGIRSTTETARGTVTTIDSSGGTRDAKVRWRDRNGTSHVTAVKFPGARAPKAKDRVVVHYLPGRADRVYVEDDTSYAKAATLLTSETYLLGVLIIVAITTAVRIWRRISTQRRPTTTVPTTRVRSKLGLIQRNWLIFTDNGRERWMPVYWEPELSDLLDDTPCAVHGDLNRNSLVSVEIGDRIIWPAGRIRTRAPRGQHTSNAGTYSKGALRKRASDPAWEPAAQLSMRRQARVDGVLAVAAPFLALMWAYINGTGVVGLMISFVVLATIVFWLPSVYGSDPT